MRAAGVVRAVFLLLMPMAAASQSPPVDRTTISNGKKLHFRIIEGRKDDIAAILEAHAMANGTTRPELAYAVGALNEQKEKDCQYARSEDALNQWGYDLLGSGSKTQPLEAFEFNSSLHPGSSNAHGSLGDAYEALGDTAAAIRSYAEALRLNPSAKRTADKLTRLRGGGK